VALKSVSQRESVTSWCPYFPFSGGLGIPEKREGVKDKENILSKVLNKRKKQ